LEVELEVLLSQALKSEFPSPSAREIRSKTIFFLSSAALARLREEMASLSPAKSRPVNLNIVWLVRTMTSSFPWSLNTMKEMTVRRKKQTKKKKRKRKLTSR